MNVYRYIAENNPNGANDICVKNGLTEADSTETISYYLESIVAQNGADSLKEIMTLHPDKEVLLECFQQPTKVEEKIVEVQVPKVMNADGQSSLANNTNIYILMGAIIVSLAIISLK